VVVGYAGRLTEAKGAHVLVEAAARLEPEVPLEVHIYGDLQQEPAYGDRLRALARNAPHVKFRGRFGRDELAEVFSALDVVAVPSLWYENNPLIAQEAFAAGRPVIASDLGGMAEFVEHEVSGWLFPPGDAGALAERLRAVALGPEQIGRMRGGLPRVRTIAEECDTLDALYASLLGVRAPAKAGPA
jgi:glycosyltransferase involved in cell wall biosynthesis